MKGYTTHPYGTVTISSNYLCHPPRDTKEEEKLIITHLVKQKDAWIGQGHPQLTGISVTSAQVEWKKATVLFTVKASAEGRAPRLVQTFSQHKRETARPRFKASFGREAAAESARWNLQFEGSRYDQWTPYARTHGWIDYSFLYKLCKDLHFSHSPAEIPENFCGFSSDFYFWIWMHEDLLRVWHQSLECVPELSHSHFIF